MTAAPPYREPAAEARREPPSSLSLEWDDAEDRPNPMRAYLAPTVGGILSVALASVSGTAAAVAAGITASWALWQMSVRRRPGALVLRVEGGDLVVERGPGAEALRVPVASIRDVEVESKAIRRVTYHQAVGAPLPSTNVSGEVDVGRVVLVREGAGAPARLTESYASYSECMLRFGKVRVFLRAHGWLPEGERGR